MKAIVVSVSIAAALVTTTAFAVDPGDRTYADPACSDRTIDPARCVIQNGPARIVVGGSSSSGGGDTSQGGGGAAAGSLSAGGTPGAIGGGFTPRAGKK